MKGHLRSFSRCGALAAAIAFSPLALTAEPAPFASCAEAQQAVRDSGHVGYLLPGDFERIYPTQRCEFDEARNVRFWEVVRTIAGNECTLGYTCIVIGDLKE